MENEGGIRPLRGENYAVDYIVEIDAYIIECGIAIPQRLAAWWLQSQAPAAESRVPIPEGVIFCLSCCHEIGDLKAMGEGEMVSVGTVRIRGTLGQRGKKDNTLLNAEILLNTFTIFLKFLKNFFKFFKFIFSFDVCSLNVECLGLQKHQVMVTSFGYCRVDGRGAPQSPNRWRPSKVRGKMGEGEMEDDRGIVMEEEGAWNLGRMGNVELHEGGYWDVGLCPGVGRSGSVGMDGADNVGSGGGVGGGCGNSSSIGSVGGS